MINWLAANKEWFFSGLGVAILMAVVSIFSYFLNNNRQAKGQSQKSGKNSINIQSKRSVNIGSLNGGNDK